MTYDVTAAEVGARFGADDLLGYTSEDEEVPYDARTLSPADRARAREIKEAQQFRQDVQRESHRLRVQKAARDAVRAEETAGIPMPDVLRLDELLAESDDPTRYRVDRLLPVDGRVILAAQFKAGKTTMVANLVRSLVDGDPFLGHYDTEPITDGTLILLDAELSRSTFRTWQRQQGYANPDRVVVIPMRGRASSFDLLDPARRAAWASIMRARGGRFFILDCLSPVLSAIGLDESPEAVGRFLAGFEAFLDEAGIKEALIVHHMGHGPERSRGASRLRDWPDAEWKLVREQDDEGGDVKADARRYFSALGRDVAENEALLKYEPITRRLTLSGGTRRETKGAKHVPAVLAYITTHPAESQRAIEAGLKGRVDRDDVRESIRLLLADRSICIHIGPRNAHQHRVITQCAECAAVRDARSSECASALYSAHYTQHTDQKDHGAHTEPREQAGLVAPGEGDDMGEWSG